jgi:hypothetical protein
MDDLGFTLDDTAQVLPGFLDELSDADLLSVSAVDAASPAPPSAGYQWLSNTSPRGFPTIDTPPATTPGRRSIPADTKEAPHEAVTVHRPPMQNSTRRRQKEEMQYLRDKVQGLEQELEAKRKALMAIQEEDKENQGTLHAQLRSKSRSRATRWQRLAKRQLAEKQRAEMQNLQLRESLLDQIKLARSLQKLLKKNASKKDSGTEVAQLRARLAFSNCCSGDSEAALYDSLLQGMDAVYAEVDSVCARHPVMRSLEEGSDVSSLHVGETEALYLEATNSKVVPFGMEETCSAVWRCLSKDHVKLADGTYHAVASAPDCIRAKAIMTLRVASAQARMQMRFAMKKYVDRDRVVLTLESASESEGPRDVLYGLKMMQRAWVVIRPVPLEGGDGAPEETIIQLCMRLTPSVAAGVLNTPGQRTGAVTELLLAAVHRNLGWLFQIVENILMEHNTQL